MITTANSHGFTVGDRVIWAAPDDRGNRHDLRATVIAIYPSRMRIALVSGSEATVSYKYVRPDKEVKK